MQTYLTFESVFYRRIGHVNCCLVSVLEGAEACYIGLPASVCKEAAHAALLHLGVREMPAKAQGFL